MSVSASHDLRATALSPSPSASTSSDHKLQVPSSSTFSFKAPFPTASSGSAVSLSSTASCSSSSAASALKQRRVSLGHPASPRLVQPWGFRDDTKLNSHVPETNSSATAGARAAANAGNALASSSDSPMPEKRGKMRKIAASPEDEVIQEKKQRKKWTLEETKMLVAGCNKHGVGNWKAILSDPGLQFDNRSPVDLKDRFRTYFPDAYKQHYPNARTHLSTKVRSTLPDGTSLFEKTRSKKRRPFTEEEDRALKAGFEKHGTVWATIAKDPIFQEQGRRSTDLRDRFRNAYPDLYKAAGYKPRSTAKKKAANGDSTPAKPILRAATDDQLSMSTTGPVRSRRRAHSNQGLLRGGTKSVPQSHAGSEDEDSSGDDDGDFVFKAPRTPILVDNVSTSSSNIKSAPAATTSHSFSGVDQATNSEDNDMSIVAIEQLSESLNNPDFLAGSQTSYTDLDGPSQTWSSGVNTPTHSAHAWSTAAASPTSSHLSADYLMSQTQSPSFSRRAESLGLAMAHNNSMIGKSAWGMQDWFSANPRLDSGSRSASSSFVDATDGLSPASPFSFHNLNHGVLDRYDLLPTSLGHDFSSEVGVGETHSTFSDELFQPNGFRGFTHHSNYAGDLIFGARTHPPQQNYYGFGSAGLGLSGVGLQLSGIDEIELTGITLEDQTDTQNAMEDDVPTDINLSIGAQQKDESPESSASLMSQNRFSLDDLVDLSSTDLHSTPPGTPLMRPRSARRPSGPTSHHHYHSAHGRSISVPPSEARSGSSQSLQPGRTSQGVQTTAMETSDPATSEMFFEHESEGQQQAQVRAQTPQHRSHLHRQSTSTQQPHTSPQDVAAGPQVMRKSLSMRSSSRPPPQQHQHQQHQHQHPHHSAPSLFPTHVLLSSVSQDPWRMSVNNSDINLPFLDLHYYGAAGGLGGMVGVSGMGDLGSDVQNVMRQGQAQALDLAQPFMPATLAAAAANHNATSTSSLSTMKTSSIPASLRQFVPQTVSQNQPGGVVAAVPPSATAPATTSANIDVHMGDGKIGMAVSVVDAAPALRNPCSTSAHHHQRGQSAVCPQDLMLRSDNKRKRASWDGGVF